MEMKPFKRLLSRDEAMEIITANIKRIERLETVPLEEASGRVLAEDAVAGFNVPPFNRSAMDGYAVKAQDTFGGSNFNPRRLKLVGVEHAGERFEGNVGSGECLQVATGSVIPEGADSVVMVENTRQAGDYVEVFQPVYPAANVSPEGEDIKRGDVVVKGGDFLVPGKIGAIAALGITAIKVLAKPVISVISTGTEVRPLGIELMPGQIYDINSYTLNAIISSNGGVPIMHDIIPDEPEALRTALREGAERDMIVLSGGSSVGARDLLYEAVDELGEVLFHGVHVKPGKPTLFGLIGEKPVFGMPGNPTSCLSNAYLFLVPALRTAAGLPKADLRQVRAEMASRVVASSGREQFLTVRMEGGKAHPVFKKSGAITSMTHADGYIVLPVNVDVIEEGEIVTVTMFN